MECRGILSFSCCIRRRCGGSFGIAILIVLTFVPFHVLHPIRVVRLRWLTLSLLAIWTGLVVFALVRDFDVTTPVTIALCAIGAYMTGSDAAIRLIGSFRA